MINSLTSAENVMYSLRTLYESYGYSQYKMSKFEEYDLYVRNKSFLLSDNIITFTDKDGKLMALKPDVTLSIVKNSDIQVAGQRRVYYNENVYRVPRGGLSYKEIMQSGLECIGEIDKYALLEVLKLAAKSLLTVSPDFVLDVSDLGILSSVIDSMNIDALGRDRLIEAVGEKNTHAISVVCSEYSVPDGKADMLISLVLCGGTSEELSNILSGSDMAASADEFIQIIDILRCEFGDKVRIDFSVIDDMRYYNGIVFKGFVKGIPTSVLSGGRYDRLMKKMGKMSGAVGFAVYLDQLSGLETETEEYDCDVFLLYGEKSKLEDVSRLADELVASGRRVQCGRNIPEKLSFSELLRAEGAE